MLSIIFNIFLANSVIDIGLLLPTLKISKLVFWFLIINFMQLTKSLTYKKSLTDFPSPHISKYLPFLIDFFIKLGSAWDVFSSMCIFSMNFGIHDHYQDICPEWN